MSDAFRYKDTAVVVYGNCVMIERDDPLNPTPCFETLHEAYEFCKRFVQEYDG